MGLIGVIGVKPAERITLLLRGSEHYTERETEISHDRGAIAYHPCVYVGHTVILPANTIIFTQHSNGWKILHGKILTSLQNQTTNLTDLFLIKSWMLLTNHS